MLTIYNTLTRSKEVFEPLVPGHVGMYVCGPTVYGDPHLGHARSAIVFDLLFRYLKDGPEKYKVRYVRNITDVGHLEHDADEGSDKIAKTAALLKIEPMEVAQLYTNRYHDAMRELNVLPPSIEPLASGHMVEQMELVHKLLYKTKKPVVYRVDSDKIDIRTNKPVKGSVYFDVLAYNERFKKKNIQYGMLSGRSLEDTVENTRTLKGQDKKHYPFDFALLKKADEKRLMKWANNPFYGMFPGWHIECTAMSTKYLGKQFDIHGGGIDLMFPHHECEIAQGVAANGVIPAKYWVHNNMITIDGQKMGKSLGNFITLEQFFTGRLLPNDETDMRTHPLLERAYSPMTIRFFMLQAHYRSTLDFSNEALQAAEKGLDRLMKAIETLNGINVFSTDAKYDETPADLEKRLTEAMDDDLNSPLAIAALFDWVRIVNQWHDGTQIRSREDKEQLQAIFHRWVFDILGLRDEKTTEGGTDRLAPVMELLLGMRADAKAAKDWALSDKIRDGLAAAGIKVKDRKDGAIEWEID